MKASTDPITIESKKACREAAESEYFDCSQNCMECDCLSVFSKKLENCPCGDNCPGLRRLF